MMARQPTKADIAAAIRDTYNAGIAGIDYWDNEGVKWAKADIPECATETESPYHIRMGEFLIIVTKPRA